MNDQEAMSKLSSLSAKVYLEHIQHYGTMGSEEIKRTIVEAIAKKIYERWYAQPGYVSWQEGGNSDKQELARDTAKSTLSMHVVSQSLEGTDYKRVYEEIVEALAQSYYSDAQPNSKWEQSRDQQTYRDTAVDRLKTLSPTLAAQ